MKMQYLEREVTKREPINRFGKLGYVLYREYFKTDKEEFLKGANKFLKIKFTSANDSIRKQLRKLDKNEIYKEKIRF